MGAAACRLVVVVVAVHLFHCILFHCILFLYRNILFLIYLSVLIQVTPSTVSHFWSSGN